MCTTVVDHFAESTVQGMRRRAKQALSKQEIEEQVMRYRARVSGPLLDRIDIEITMPRPTESLLSPAEISEASAAVRDRVETARSLRVARAGKPNAQMEAANCTLAPSERRLLEQAMTRLGLSGRGLHRVLKVARTIADLDREAEIGAPHLLEAIGYRTLEGRN